MADLTPSDPLRLTLAGWLGLLIFAILVAVFRGPDEFAFAAVSGVIAVAIGTWLWRRRSRAARIVSLVVGGLEALEQGGYSVADLTSRAGAGTTAADLFGLLAALAVVVGSGLLLARRRSTLPA